LYGDPSGKAIALSGDWQQMQQELNAICDAAGISSADCSYYLYANAVQDENGNVTYYVGICTNGADAQGTSFQNLNSIAATIGSIINDPRVVQLDILASGQTVTDYAGEHRRIGPLGMTKGTEPAATYLGKDGKWHIALLDPNTDPGTLPASLMRNYKPGYLNETILLGHELGHIKGEWWPSIGERVMYFLFRTPKSNHDAVNLENKVRRITDRLNPNPLEKQTQSLRIRFGRQLECSFSSTNHHRC